MKTPVRSFFYLLLLGVTLASIGLVVRSGMWLREDPGQPINAAMRIAFAETANVWPERDQMIVARDYPGAPELPSGTRFFITRAGEGTDTPRRGQLVTVNYVGRFIDGTVFDDSERHGGPFNFVVGENRVLPGWDEGIMRMKRGEKRLLFIPYWMGYGEKGVRNKIPPRATLVFEIELVDFR